MNEDFILPVPIGTRYNYVMASRHGRVIYLAGQIAKVSETEVHATGRCGLEVDLLTAMRNAEIAAGQAISWLKYQLEPNEHLDRILRTTVYIAVGDMPFDISVVADAASSIFINALGDRGRHPRSVIGVSGLPRNVPVLLEVTASVARKSA